MTHKVRVWDLPTRIFHWALALCFLALVVTGSIGIELMVWHFRLGCAVLSLLLFRLLWGFAGARWSRFASFVPTPATLLAYLRRPSLSVGHNPLGALSVLAMLALLLLQVVSGMCSDDEVVFAGPLTAWVSNATVKLATHYHRVVGKPLLFALLLLHLAAIAFHRFKRGEKLLGAMLHGDKLLEQDAEPSRDDARSRALAALLFALCAAAVATLVRLLG